jgi:hypothetical protein
MTTTNSMELGGEGTVAPQSVPASPKINPAALRLSPAPAYQHEAGKQQPHSRPAYLLKYSLQGMGDELAERAAKVEPLLGNVCLRGEATMWYAPPNAGKTLFAISLIIDAISSGRIDGEKVVYINMDDNSEGLAQKVRLLEDHGVHVIAPGHRNFESSKLMPTLQQMIDDHAVNGLFLVIDTVKKVADLMDKRKSSDFSGWARRWVQKGGTLLGLAHTNKNTGANGKLVYSGTTDLLDDFDCAYLLSERPDAMKAGLRLIEFTNQKRRGNAAGRAIYCYNAREGVSYVDRVTSVEAVDDLDFEPLVPPTGINDTDIASALAKAISSGNAGKMELMKTVATELNVSRRRVKASLSIGPDRFGRTRSRIGARRFSGCCLNRNRTGLSRPVSSGFQDLQSVGAGLPAGWSPPRRSVPVTPLATPRSPA